MKIALCVAVCLTVVLFSQESSAGSLDQMRKEAEKLFSDVKGLLEEASANARNHAKAALPKLKERLITLHKHITSWFNGKPPSVIQSSHDLILSMLNEVQKRIEE